MKTFLQSILSLSRYRVLSQTFNSLKRIVRPKHEPEVFALSNLIEEGGVVCEVGANYAQYSRVLSRLVGSDGQVWAFEPAEITYRCLQRNCRILRLKNVFPQQLALSDKPGTVELHTPIKRKGVFGVAQAALAPDPTTETLKETVAVETLDSFLAKKGVTSVSFIRCDVEGAEMLVFLGAQNTLKHCRPSILVEVHPEMMKRFGHTTEELKKFFVDMGYEFAVWKNNSFEPIESLQFGNIFCLPKA